jgi:hypothetical protein
MQTLWKLCAYHDAGVLRLQGLLALVQRVCLRCQPFFIRRTRALTVLLVQPQVAAAAGEGIAVRIETCALPLPLNCECLGLFLVRALRRGRLRVQRLGGRLQ